MLDLQRSAASAKWDYLWFTCLLSIPRSDFSNTAQGHQITEYDFLRMSLNTQSISLWTAQQTSENAVQVFWSSTSKQVYFTDIWIHIYSHCLLHWSHNLFSNLKSYFLNRYVKKRPVSTSICWWGDFLLVYINNEVVSERVRWPKTCFFNGPQTQHSIPQESEYIQA